MRNYRVKANVIAGALALSLGGAFGLVDGDANGSAQVLPSFCREEVAEDVRPSPASSHTGVLLGANKRYVEGGEFIYARLLNFGSKIAGYGWEFLIERHTVSGWTLDPSSPKGPWIKKLGLLKPGAASLLCYKFQIPKGQPKGRYRFSTRVSYLGHGILTRRTAEFFVR